jgi:hypothetical protein
MVKFTKGTSVRLLSGQRGVVVAVHDRMNANIMVGAGAGGEPGAPSHEVTDGMGGGPGASPAGAHASASNTEGAAGEAGGAEAYVSVKLSTTGSIVKVPQSKVSKGA